MERRRLNAILLSILAVLCLVLVLLAVIVHQADKMNAGASSEPTAKATPTPVPTSAVPAQPESASKPESIDDHRCSMHSSIVGEGVAKVLAQAIGVNYHPDEWDAGLSSMDSEQETCVISAEYKIDGARWNVTLNDKTLKTVSLEPTNTAARVHMGTE